MHFTRRALLASLVFSVGVALGCDKNSKGMQNMQLGTGPAVKMDMPLKKKPKPMPADPAGPKAPP
jgi:hypothetical protein